MGELRERKKEGTSRLRMVLREGRSRLALAMVLVFMSAIVLYIMDSMMITRIGCMYSLHWRVNRCTIGVASRSTANRRIVRSGSVSGSGVKMIPVNSTVASSMPSEASATPGPSSTGVTKLPRTMPVTANTINTVGGITTATKRGPAAAQSMVKSVELRGLIPFDCTQPTSWIQQCGKSCTRGAAPIPRLVHFVQIGDTLGFTQWLSVMSAVRFLRPQRVILHHIDNLTTCWARRIRSHPLVRFNRAERSDFPSTLNGKKVTHLAHLADFMRVSALWQYGGIYMDLDSIVTKPFDDLLGNEAVFSLQYDGNICNGLMLSRKASCCLCAFSKRMCSDYDGSWDHHSVKALTALLTARTCRYSSDAVRILQHQTGFVPFSWKRRDMMLLFKRNATQSQFTPDKVYALHMYNKAVRAYGLEDDTTFSAIAKGQTPYAVAARNIIPASFTFRHLNEDVCGDVPLVRSAIP
eukprot:scpid81784/ scgid23569/ 